LNISICSQNDVRVFPAEELSFDVTSSVAYATISDCNFNLSSTRWCCKFSWS